MDANIRRIIVKAQNIEDYPNPALLQAYSLLKNAADARASTDIPESFGSDLFVLCAESAYQCGYTDIAKDCLKMFFMKQPAPNQFLGRAYICQAQLLSPKNSNDQEQLEKSVAYILKAISFAKSNSRYHFLVYNASVIYWQLCRPFLKLGCRQYLVTSLQQIVKTLEDIDDKDLEWRAQLLIALVECHIDAHKRSDASQVASTASTFIKTHVPALYKKIFGLMIRYQLGDIAKNQKELKTSQELAIYHRICKLRSTLNPTTEIFSGDQPSQPISMLDLSDGSDKAMSLVNSEQGDPSTNYSSEIENLLHILVETDSIAQINSEKKFSTDVNREDDNDKKERAGRNTSKSLNRFSIVSPKNPQLPSDQKISKRERCNLLVELARLCLELNFADQASICVEKLKTLSLQDPIICLEQEFIECELMIKIFGDKQESLHKSVAEVREKAIKRCEEAVMNAIRIGDPNVIQAGCVTQWNLCLPFLQPNLRKKVRRPLTLVAEALEQIDSLLLQLRCQVHIELSQCEEDQEQIQTAVDNLKKALLLDDTGFYHEKLETALHRLELKAQLYKQPERSEDLAAMIIEQARAADSGSINMKRSLLVKAGEALAPDSFLLVLDSENEAKEMSTGKETLTKVKQLLGKAKQYKKCIGKTEGHLNRMVETNIKERIKLWVDLVKVARKQEVWDVCRTACKFCLLYDEDKPLITAVPSAVVKDVDNLNIKPEASQSEISKEETTMELEKKVSSRITSQPVTQQASFKQAISEQIRMLAEVSFIQGEALIQLLRSHNEEFNNKPVYPEDKSKKPKGFVPKKPEEDMDWIEYSNWITDLSKEATKNFLRGLDLGVAINEPWIVCSAAAYIWNYNNHLLAQGREDEIVADLSVVLEGLKKVGHAGETVMLINICNALAKGYMKNWLPKPQIETEKPDTKPEVEPASGKKGSKSVPPVASKMSKAGSLITISPEALMELKKAIEICEFAMKVTNGSEDANMVPISARLPVLQTWVRAKQLAQQPISKSLGADEEIKKGGQNLMTKAIVAVEILTVNKNGLMEFKDTVNLEEVIVLLKEAKWSEKFIELQLWARLAGLALASHIHNLVMLCSTKALRFENRQMKLDSNQEKVKQEMLSYSCLLMGKSLIENMKGRRYIRGEALEAFVNSVKFARNANNYEMVMTAARHFWNACLPLVSKPIERELLKEPLKLILKAIASEADKQVKDKMSEDNENNQSKKESEKLHEDLSLRAAMYGVLFQSFADKCQWDEALESIDHAVSSMPRTKHRLILFKHRVMVKAKLGQAIDWDMQKFMDEPEDFIASMWHRVALSSKLATEQMKSYQKAIDVLQSPTNVYQKVEYLLEFGQWLYCNHFPIKDVQDQLDCAIDLLLCIKPPETPKINAEGKRSKASSRRLVTQAAPIKEKVSSSSVHQTLSRSPSKHKEVGLQKTVSNLLLPSSPAPESVDERLDVFSSDRNLESVSTSMPTLRPINQLSDIRQLDALYRVYIFSAEMMSMESVQYKDSLLIAYNVLLRLWEVLIQNFGQSMKEIAKNGIPTGKEEEKSPRTASTVAKGKKEDKKKDDKEKEKEKDKPKRKRKFPLDALPTELESWAVYDWPEEGIYAFKLDNLKAVAINESNIPKPMLTYHCTDSLIKQLAKVGYTHCSLPLLAYQDLLSRSILSSQALFRLVHLRSLIICQELNLKTGVTYHHKIVGNLHISEVDQALCRNEIARWQELQNQVANEERKAREISAKEESISSKVAISSLCINPTNDEQKEIVDGEPHLGKVLSAVSMRDVWTDTAELLIRQAQYQRAREYLTEANIAAEAFNDKALQVKIVYLLANLAYHEAQYEQAVELCMKTQELNESNDIFCYKNIKLLVKATAMMTDSKNINKAKRTLVNAIMEFTAYGDTFPNRYKASRYFCAKLETMLLRLYINNLLLKLNVECSDQTLELICAGCERFQTLTNQLIHLGQWQSAKKLMLKHAQLLKNLAFKESSTDLSKMHYIQSLHVFEEAVNISEKIFHDAHSLVPLAQMNNMNTAVQRELAEVYIETGELLTTILTIRHNDLVQTQLQREKRDSIVVQIEDFVNEVPVFTKHEKEWLDICSTAGDQAMSYFLSAQNLCSSIVKLKAKYLVGMGKLLHIVAELASPEPPFHWTVHDVEVMKMQLEAEEAEALAAMQDAEDAEDDEEESAEERSISKVTSGSQQKTIETEEARREIKYAALIMRKWKEQEKSLYYFKCASEYLYHGLNFCLQNQIIDAASVASYELLTLIAQYDPQGSSLMLALHQSCQTSLKLEELLYLSLPDPTTSKLAGMLHQKQHLLRNDVTNNNSAGPLYKDLKISFSSDWQAGKKLEVSTNHVDLLKEFPANYNFIVLQHSPDKKNLYCALLDKPKGAVGGVAKAKDKNIPPQIVPEISIQEDVSRSKIFSAAINYNSFENMIEKIKVYKQQQQTVLLRREFHRVQVAQREKMLENVEESKKNVIKIADNYEEEEAELEALFADITNEMNNYLQPVLEPVCFCIRYPNGLVSMSINTQDASGKTSREAPTPQNECVILLADTDLMELPLEACLHLQLLEGVISISRDFSLQILRRRAQEEKRDDKDDKDLKKKTSKDIVNINSRIPGAREAKQKQTKIVPLNRQAQAWQAEVNTNNFKYIVDPYLECSDGEEKKPIEVMNKIIHTYESQFTAKWLGLSGSLHTPSLGEWEIYISESSAFIFYGFERFLSYLPPGKMATLNVPDCSILFSLDQSESAKSFQRQSKLDLHKLPSLNKLESPVPMAMLASLTGIRCIIGNQWHASLSENSKKFEESMEFLLKKGFSTGQTLYMLQNPVKAYNLAKLEAKVEAVPTKAVQKSADSKSKGNANEPPVQIAPADEDKGPELTRAAYNAVCYGMPNLIVTQ